MKNIKTYEGFFDFLKKKKKVSNEPVYIDDIKECLLDLTEEPRIINSIDSRVCGIFNDYDDVFKVRKNGSFDSDYEELARSTNSLYGGELPLPIYIKGNMMAVRISYDDDKISNEEVKRLLEICSSKLKTYNCVTTFYLAFGHDEGHTYDKEYKSVDKLFHEIIRANRSPNITIKIIAPTKILK